MDLAARKTRASLLRGREARVTGGGDFELRDANDDGISLSGYASVTETPYPMGWYDETIARGAFAETLSRSPDVQLLINHAGEPLARTTVKSGLGALRLTEDGNGLRVDASLNPDDPDVQRLRMKASMGLMDQMSFAFSGARSEWDEDFTQRRIVGLEIHRGDVSSVNQGASSTTSFAMRSLVEQLIAPSDEQLAELRDQFTPSDIRAALATLAMLAPADEPDETPAPQPVRDLDLYRARAFALRARG